MRKDKVVRRKEEETPHYLFMLLIAVLNTVLRGVYEEYMGYYDPGNHGGILPPPAVITWVLWLFVFRGKRWAYIVYTIGTVLTVIVGTYFGVYILTALAFGHWPYVGMSGNEGSCRRWLQNGRYARLLHTKKRLQGGLPIGHPRGNSTSLFCKVPTGTSRGHACYQSHSRRIFHGLRLHFAKHFFRFAGSGKVGHTRQAVYPLPFGQNTETHRRTKP